ncbi:hypothetical protein D3C78_1853560 [compost metagenome]
MKNNTQLWPENGWELIEANDDTGIDYELTINVAAGDRIYFILNKHVYFFSDATIWNPVISYN